MKLFIWPALVLSLVASAFAANGYRLLKKIPLSGDGNWDYLIVDSPARRVYVSHGNEVNVLDADSGNAVGKIPNTNGVHGIAVAPELERGFVSDGRAGAVTIFDRKTLKTIGEVPVGQNPDAIIYEPVMRRVFVFNAQSKTASVINAADGKVAATIDLGGVPEGPVPDGKGTVFVNLKDEATNQMLRIDSKEMAIKERWKVGEAGCTDPGNTAMDRMTRRLFVRCKDRAKNIAWMSAINADNGKIVAKLPIGSNVDSAAFDPDTKLIFFPDGDGKVTIIHEDSADKYSLVENVETQKGARTIALDVKSHRIFLPTAQYGPAQENGRPRTLPGTFTVLMMGMEEK